LTDKTGKTLPRRAGLSSFGFGGVNAHVVIEEYVTSSTQRVKYDQAVQTYSGPYLIVVSAKTEEQLQQSTKHLADFVFAREDEWDHANLTRLAYTLQTGREAMSCRMSMVVTSRDSLVEKL